MTTTAELDAQIPERPRHRMVDRVASILEAVARSGSGMTLTAIAKALGAPVSSTQGLVNGLVATGYLDERDRVYTLGMAPYLLNVIAGRPPVTQVPHDALEAINEETGMVTVLSAAVGDDLFYVDHVSSDPAYAYLAENRLRRSLLRTSAGWVLLAARENRDLWAYLNARPEADSGRVEAFLEALAQIRETGICAAPHAAEKGADGVSVAVTERGGTIAAVGVIGSRAEIDERRDDLVEILGRHVATWQLD
ncbi:IclR family transcriptional regulator [Dietzia sp. NPDC055340]|mgnify:CR=1 FL=1|uniref:IclR family transcriptional regulator n=1 Tax=Dietzia aurantiaca TaxID=983873 RepID=UPI001E5CF577|nr:helix-turn-helix domain-containing protein [Dietzia aurantiaca]